MATTKRIDLFIRPTSTITKNEAIEYAYNKANKRDASVKNKLTNYAHYYDITDSRSGEKYMVFGDKAQSILKLSKSFDILNKTDILKGFTDDIIIDNENGTIHIPLNTDNEYNVFLQVKNSLQAIARVENETKEGFDIVLYDAQTYAEDEIKLDCSNNNITINYNVIYE